MLGTFGQRMLHRNEVNLFNRRSKTWLLFVNKNKNIIKHEWQPQCCTSTTWKAAVRPCITLLSDRKTIWPVWSEQIHSNKFLCSSFECLRSLFRLSNFDLEILHWKALSTGTMSNQELKAIVCSYFLLYWLKLSLWADTYQLCKNPLSVGPLSDSNLICKNPLLPGQPIRAKGSVLKVSINFVHMLLAAPPHRHDACSHPVGYFQAQTVNKDYWFGNINALDYSLLKKKVVRLE